jgi:uncharacterized membrane protein
MNKSEFLSELKKHVQKLPKSEQEAVFSDYEEHFEHGVFEGRSEEEIAKSLGHPKRIARELLTEYHLIRAEQTHSYVSVIRVVFTSLGLGLLNLIFVLAPFLVILSILIACYAVSLAFVISPLSLFFYLSSQVGWQSLLLLFFITLGLLGTGLLFGTSTTILTKKFFSGFIRYLKSNLNIIRRERT